MTLSKYFIDWVTVFNKNPDQSLHYLRRRLLIAYILILVTVLGISEIALYTFFTRSLNQQLDHRLRTLAQAAAPSLETIKSEGRYSLDRGIPWRELFSHRQQSLEWFGVDGQLLAREGEAFPRSPLKKDKLSSSLDEGSPIFQQEKQIRSASIAVYANGAKRDILHLKGYIRASESTSEIEDTLNQLTLGLWLGGGTAIFLISISSIYLTYLAFKPTLQSFQQLKQFAADASHELGGPLTKISFATEILLSSPEQLKKSSAPKKIKIIRNASEQMKHLLEDLLFLARTDTASPLIEPGNSTVFLDELLPQLMEDFKVAAQSKNIEFKLILRQKELTVKGDAPQLNRLFSNLLNNALKYTERGGRILLSLGVVNKNAVISIEDTGIGIDPKYLPYVFQRFWRAERVSKKEGLGLGLAIAQTIAKQHQGKITVTSEVNVGTCFQVYLPLI